MAVWAVSIEEGDEGGVLYGVASELKNRGDLGGDGELQLGDVAAMQNAQT